MGSRPGKRRSALAPALLLPVLELSGFRGSPPPPFPSPSSPPPHAIAMVVMPTKRNARSNFRGISDIDFLLPPPPPHEVTTERARTCPPLQFLLRMLAVRGSANQASFEPRRRGRYPPRLLSRPSL